MLPFPKTAVSAVRRSFPAARLDCGVTLEGGSLTLTKEAPPFRREERRARSEHRLDRRRVCEIGRHGRSAPRERSGDFVWTGEHLDWMPVDVLKADEGAAFALAGILERPLMELHVGVVVEQDVHRLVRRALDCCPVSTAR